MLEELKEKGMASISILWSTWTGDIYGEMSRPTDRESGLVVIKPSGVSYDKMKVKTWSWWIWMERLWEGIARPSSDVHRPSSAFTRLSRRSAASSTRILRMLAWAQAGKDIPNIGTTHADYFHDAVPCTDDMTEAEVKSAYELETGNVIVRRFKGLNPVHTPRVLVKNHGPFTWGKDADEAVYNAVVLEQVAKMASIGFSDQSQSDNESLSGGEAFQPQDGPNAYYGQKK